MTCTPSDFCSVRDVERFLSPLGVDHFVDHNNDEIRDPAVIEDAIAFGSSQIRNYLCTRYNAEDYASNPTVREWNTILAARRICTSRANPIPDSVELRYQEILAEMEKYRSGMLNLCGVARQDSGTPTHSNLLVDRRYARSRVRVVQETSSKVPSEVVQKFAPPPVDPGRQYE